MLASRALLHILASVGVDGVELSSWTALADVVASDGDELKALQAIADGRLAAFTGMSLNKLIKLLDLSNHDGLRLALAAVVGSSIHQLLRGFATDQALIGFGESIGAMDAVTGANAVRPGSSVLDLNIGELALARWAAERLVREVLEGVTLTGNAFTVGE